MCDLSLLCPTIRAWSMANYYQNVLDSAFLFLNSIFVLWLCAALNFSCWLCIEQREQKVSVGHNEWRVQAFKGYERLRAFRESSKKMCAAAGALDGGIWNSSLILLLFYDIWSFLYFVLCATVFPLMRVNCQIDRCLKLRMNLTWLQYMI